jgi:small subunit ribosomal protein S9
MEKNKDILEDEKETTTDDIQEEKEVNINEKADFTGKYIKAVGRRKTSVAQVRLFEGGKGIIVINDKKATEYFPGEDISSVTQPLKVTGHNRDFNFSIITKGGGKKGQLIAVRLGIARTLLAYDPESKEALKANGFLTRDPRQVERKKPGLRKARKAPQWSKR